MIGTIDTKVQSHSPDFPLETLKSFVGSPSSIRVRNVPKRIGNWNITNVFVTVVYPDNTTRTIESLLTGGVYVATMEGCNVSGKVENGLTITANGKDENDNLVTGYVLGKGDVEILSAMENVSPGQTVYYIHLLEDEPDVPKNGDMYKKDGNYVVYQNGVETPLGVSQENMESYVDGKIEDAVEQIETQLEGKASVTEVENLQDSVEELETSIGNVDEKVDTTKTELQDVITELQESKADASSLELKQDKLSEDQNYVLAREVNDLYTIIQTVSGGTFVFKTPTTTFDKSILIEQGILAEDGTTWIYQPVTVIMGSNVITINSGTFQNATNLLTFRGENVGIFQSNVFSGCTALRSVNIPNAASIGTWMFRYCSALTTLILPESVSSVSRNAFVDSSFDQVFFEGKTLAEVKAMTNYSRWGLAEDKIYTNAFENQLPTKTSDLANDSGFITAADIITKRDLNDLNIYVDPIAEHTPIEVTVWHTSEISTLYVLNWDGSLWYYTDGNTSIQINVDSYLNDYVLNGSIQDMGGTYRSIGGQFDLTSPLWSADFETQYFPKIEVASVKAHITTKEYVDSRLSALEARIAALENNA